jgi:type II secretory pathway pseudopilin PulG
MHRSNRTIHEAGQTLLEMAVVLMILGLIAGVAVPATLGLLRRIALQNVVSVVSGTMVLARENAQGQLRARAVKFSRGTDGWRMSVYEDGNGNGVLNSEIVTGVDPLVSGPLELKQLGVAAWIGFPDDPVSDPDTGQPFGPDSPPVEFNSSTLCSFSPVGSSTPGTVFLTNGFDAAMVRASGKSGLLTVRYYDRASGIWQ